MTMVADGRPPAYLEWERDRVYHGCKDKYRFTSHGRAKRMANRITGGGVVYHCSRCAGWHITSKRP